MIITLFLTFAKIGLFTFGGGYAMISLIESICVEQKRWITHEQMMKITVVAESTPGPIAINCATYIGYKQKGIAGAVAATLGVVTPSFIIIYLISKFLENFLEIQGIVSGFKGIRIAVGILILDAAIGMIKKMKKKTIPCIILGCSFVIMLLNNIINLGISSILLLVIAAIAGMIISGVSEMSAVKGGADK
ncbi:MAG: chromate transporter [Butyrivibrio sp.]|uniref:chromate transporter n=1 Tax=Butyrivibrio sp. TaxID=28121 RepID=UPI0025B82AE3|nr:chromate transporter [Butyrivibrio sp.]MBQ6589785.1 chromate transporter [Butyrivibrio sp.]